MEEKETSGNDAAGEKIMIECVGDTFGIILGQSSCHRREEGVVLQCLQDISCVDKEEVQHV